MRRKYNRNTAASFLFALLILLSFGAIRPAMAHESVAAPLALAAATATPSDEHASSMVLKAGAWTMQDRDVKDPDTRSSWELAFGGKINRYVGTELGFGYQSTDGKFLSLDTKTRMVPVNFSLRFGVPVVLVEPYVLVGGGLYVTTIEVGSASTTTVKPGYHGSLGVDFNLGSFIAGIEGRYFVITGEALGRKIELDGKSVALKAGFRF